MSGLAAIILAAGQGTRMRSKLPKVLHPLLGRPMLKYVTDVARNTGSNPIFIVVGYEGEQVIQALGIDYQYIWQHQQLGTGHAVMAAKDLLSNLDGDSDLLVLYGDTPLLRESTLKELIDLKQKSQAQAAVLTAVLANPAGYGRIIRNAADFITGIVEDKDANEAQKAITEVNTGVYCFTVTHLLKALEGLSPVNAQGEYYLTDVFKIFFTQGLRIAGLRAGTAIEVMGPNDRLQLANTEKMLRQIINNQWMQRGVTIQDPEFTYIGPQVEIGPDTTIMPGTFLLGQTKIGSNCIIGPHSRIIDSQIETGTCVQFSQVIGALVGPNDSIGPFVFIRPEIDKP